MAIIRAEICQCDECEKRWLAEGDPPKRCSRCKSSKWNVKGRTDVQVPDSERIQSLLAAAVAAQAVEAELREEIRTLKRQLRESSETDVPKRTPAEQLEKAQKAIEGRLSDKCPHGKSWYACIWKACKDRVEATRIQREIPASVFQEKS